MHSRTQGANRAGNDRIPLLHHLVHRRADRPRLGRHPRCKNVARMVEERRAHCRTERRRSRWHRRRASLRVEGRAAVSRRARHARHARRADDHARRRGERHGRRRRPLALRAAGKRHAGPLRLARSHATLVDEPPCAARASALSLESRRDHARRRPRARTAPERAAVSIEQR